MTKTRRCQQQENKEEIHKNTKASIERRQYYKKFPAGKKMKKGRPMKNKTQWGGMTVILEGDLVHISLMEQLDGDDESEAALFQDMTDIRWHSHSTCVKVTSAGTRGTLEDAELHLSANRGISPISKKTHRYNTVYHYAIDPEVWYVYSSFRK